jgi:hypothetical protein
MKKILLAISVMVLAVGCQRNDDIGAPGEGVERDTMRDNGVVTNDVYTPTTPPPPRDTTPGTVPPPPPDTDDDDIGTVPPPPPQQP